MPVCFFEEETMYNTSEHYADINARVIDNWVENGWEWGQAIDHETI